MISSLKLHIMGVVLHWESDHKSDHECDLGHDSLGQAFSPMLFHITGVTLLRNDKSILSHVLEFIEPLIITYSLHY